MPGGAFRAAAEPANRTQPGPHLSMKGDSMKIKERLTQKIYPDKWEELDALDQKYNQIESAVNIDAENR